MKKRVKVTSILITTLVLFSFLVLVGCVSTKQKFQDDMIAQGVKPLTGPEIQNLFSNAKEKSKNSKYEYEGFYSADGKTKARVWGAWGEEADEGEWKVDSDGHLCIKYLGAWSNAGERCYTVYPGKTETDYTLIKMTGSQSKGFPSGVVPIKVTPGM